MTADAPADAAHPLRFVQPVVVALASAGVVTLTAGQLFRNQQMLPDVVAPVSTVTWLAPVIAVVMLTLPAAVIAMLPALGGWPVVAAGLGVSTLVIQMMLGQSGGDAIPVWTLVVVAGYATALGGVMAAAAQAPAAERIAIAAGVAFGFGGYRINLDLLTFEPYGSATALMMPLYVLVGLSIVASVMASARPARDAPQRGFAVVIPVVAAVAVIGIIQLGHYVRRLVVDEFRVSEDGLASQRRIDTVAAFAEYSAIALAAGAGLILLWLAYRRGKADLARWVVLGFALGGPILMVLFGFHYGGSGQATGLGVTAALATACGVVLALLADRLFAWEALGVAVTAFGLIIGSVSDRFGPSWSQIAYLLIAGGFAFAFASGLTRILRVTATATATGTATGTATAGHVAVSLLLGLVALLATATAIAPAAWLLANSSGFGGFQLSVPITSLVAAGVLLLLFGFGRVVDRVRREIQEQAAPPPSH